MTNVVYYGLTHFGGLTMTAKTTGQLAEIARLKKELKEAKRQLADEILDHRIDIAALEIAAEIYHFDHVALKKKNAGTKLPIA